MNYIHFSEEDFALNESFQNWVLKTNAEDTIFWEKWILQHPHKQGVINRAIEIVRSLAISEAPLSEAEIDTAWKQLHPNLRKRVDNSFRLPYSQGIPQVRLQRYYGIAAAFLLVAIGGILYWVSSSNELVVYQTAYGHTSEVRLPDGSIVTLNGNTALRYHQNWRPDRVREVWIDGEAFFSIVPIDTSHHTSPSPSAKFIVHTPDLSVEVMGTTFNVYKRKEKTRVVLNTGQVKVRVASNDANTWMTPGELVEFSSQTEQLSKRKVNPDMYSAWKNKMLIFDNTPLSEVAQLIEDTYGIKVLFVNAQQASRKLSGTIPSDNLEVLLFTLSKSFNLSIQSKTNQNQILIN